MGLPAATAPKSAASNAAGKDMCKQNFDEYRDKIKTNPDDEKAWQELRVCADLLKRWGESGAIASAAIERGVVRAEPHLILGMAHYRMKDYPLHLHLCENCSCNSILQTRYRLI